MQRGDDMSRAARFRLFLLFVGLSMLVGALAGVLNADGIAFFGALEKPSFSPPGWLFAPVWALLYFLNGAAMWRVYLSGISAPRKRRALELWGFQLLLNFLWPFVFFTLSLYWAALACLGALWLAALICMIFFFFADTAAGFLQLPYQLWLSFALLLNAAVAVLN